MITRLFYFILLYCSILLGAQNSNPLGDIKVLYSTSVLDFILMHSLKSNIYLSQIKHHINSDSNTLQQTRINLQNRRSPLLSEQSRRGIRNLNNQEIKIQDKVYDDFYLLAGYVNATIDSINSQGYNVNTIYNINANDYLIFTLFASFINTNSKDSINNIKQNNISSGLSIKFSSSLFEFSATSGFNYGLNHMNSSMFNNVLFNHNYIFGNINGGFIIDTSNNNFIKPLIGLDVIYSPKYDISNNEITISTNNYLSLSAFGGVEFSMHYNSVLLYFFPSYQYRFNPTMHYSISGIQSIPNLLDVTNSVKDYVSLLIGANFAMTKKSFIFLNGLYLGSFKGSVNSFNINLGFKFLI